MLFLFIFKHTPNFFWPSHTKISILINSRTGEKRLIPFFPQAFSSVSLFTACIFSIACAQGCPQYWPEEGMLRYGPVQVECMSCSMDCDVISRLFRVCNLTRVSTTLFFSANPCFVSFRSVIDWENPPCDLSATGRLPDGSPVPVPGMGGAQRSARLQAFLPQADPAGGPVAARGRGGRGENHRALPVSAHPGEA